MSDILCKWLNTELRISRAVEPLSLAKDFSNGYLLGEILHKHQLQEDFQQFSKHSTANAKLNNFTRLEPTLQLLGVPFDLGTAKALMDGQHGAAPHLLYRLYILLQKKTRLGLTGAMLETMQPAAVTRLHRVEKQIYTERLRMMVKREADVRMQEMAQRFDKRARDAYSRSVTSELEREERRRHLQEQMRLQQIQKQRQARRKQQEIMDRIQAAAVQIPKPPASRSVRAQSKHRHQHPPGTQISEFEKNRKRPSPASCPASVSLQVNKEQMEEWNNAYVQKIRKRLEEDAMAQEQREKRCRRVLIQQLDTHQTHEEVLWEEQLIGRLMRQSQQERRMAVQLMQTRQQKEVLRQNRVLREREIHEQRLRDFQQSLEQDAALLQQDRLNHKAELCKEQELHKCLAAERAQFKHRKHLNTCRGILEQVVDLATKTAEYRLLTANQIPVKLLREWNELWMSGKPLYKKEPIPEQEVESEKLHILNEQDYTDYTSMTGEWVWPEEAESRAPPHNNDILGHIVSHLRNLANPPELISPPPAFPHCTLQACVLGKVCSGKTTCLERISRAHGIQVLSADALIQEVLEAHRAGAPESEVTTGSSDSSQQEAEEGEWEELHAAHGIQVLSADALIQEVLEAHRAGAPESEVTTGSSDSSQQEAEEGEWEELHAEPLSASEPESQSPEQFTECLLSRHGAAVEEALKTGGAVPDDLLILIITDAIRKVPSDQGWVLDGFPVEISQARLLEQALGGVDLHQERINRQATGHELAVDRNAPQAPPPASPVLHLAVLLEVSDEQVLERYQQSVQERTMNPEHPGTSQEQRQVQHRILGFQDSWSRLEDWFGVEQKILVKMNADVDEDAVYGALESALLHAMDTVEEGSETAAGDTVEDPHVQEQESEQCDDSKMLAVSYPVDAEAPPPEPGSSSWVYVDDQLPKDITEKLLSQWKNMCSSYVSNVKAVMQNLRKERNLIIHHLYNIREEYKQYLMRPDLKQEFVCVWQHEYNSVSDDMRHEEETKSELHQRLEDLRERLLDICGKRKEEAVQEKAALAADSWLENHTYVLINHYCTLTQVEVDRFQYTLRLLRDYYSGVYSGAEPEAAPEFTSVRLLTITNATSNQPESTRSFPGSAEKGTKGAGKKEPETEEKKKPRVPSSADSSKKVSVHSNEKLLQGFHHTAVTAVTQMATAEMQQLEQEENKESQLQMERKTAHTPVPTAQSPKDKKKGGKKKDPLSPITPSPVEETAEEVQKSKVRNRMRLEYRAALKHEEHSVCERLARVKLQCVETVQNLQTRAEAAYREMEELGGARFLSEVNSIDQLADIIGHHIESGTLITHQLTLVSSSLFIDGDTRVVVPSPPPLQPVPTEVTNQGSLPLTVQQLYELHSHLFNIAPTGLVSCGTLCEVLSLCVGSDVLSEAWMCLTDSQDCEMVDWRQFLLSAARPWPLPSQTQLINTLNHFKKIDTAGGGVITLQEYLQVELWFPTQTEPPVPDESAGPQRQAARLTDLRKFFFTLFSDSAHSPPACDYKNMLFYFCAHPDPACGFTRALSLVTQHTLRYTHTTRLLQSYVTDGVCGGGADGDEEEEEVCGRDEGGVSVDDILRVVNLRSARVPFQHTTTQNTEELQQELVVVFKHLGFEPEEKIPFHLLSQQPVLQELMDSSQYLLPDFSRVLDNQQCSSAEDPAGETVCNTSAGAE